jgi:peptidoglycan/LPS O-acetylase OafA/YrhL
VDLSAYFRRRALRILPLYYGVVVFTASVVAVASASAGVLVDSAVYLVFLNHFVNSSPPLPLIYTSHWWSLATEVQFYVALPMIGWALRRRWTAVAASLAVFTAYAAFASGWWRVTPNFYYALSHGCVGRAPAFVFGIALAWFYDRHGDALRDRLEHLRVMRLGGSDAIVAVLLCVLATMLQRVTEQGYFRTEVIWPWWHLYEAGVWTLVVLLVLVAPLRGRGALSNAATQIAGTLSYSIYLTHLPLMNLVYPTLRQRGVTDALTWSPLGVGVAVGLALVTVVLSLLTYTTLERPFLVRKAKIDR